MYINGDHCLDTIIPWGSSAQKEPFQFQLYNTLTNIFYIIAGFLLLKSCLNKCNQQLGIFLIGVGFWSTFYHATSTEPGFYFDITSMVIFAMKICYDTFPYSEEHKYKLVYTLGTLNLVIVYLIDNYFWDHYFAWDVWSTFFTLDMLIGAAFVIIRAKRAGLIKESLILRVVFGVTLIVIGASFAYNARFSCNGEYKDLFSRFMKFVNKKYKQDYPSHSVWHFFSANGAMYLISLKDAVETDLNRIQKKKKET